MNKAQGWLLIGMVCMIRADISGTVYPLVTAGLCFLFSIIDGFRGK